MSEVGPEITFKPDGSIRSYRVLLDGVDIGEVRHWERRYNLRRVIVTKGWRARTVDGERLYHGDSYTAETRLGAATALALRVRRDA